MGTCLVMAGALCLRSMSAHPQNGTIFPLEPPVEDMAGPRARAGCGPSATVPCLDPPLQVGTSQSMAGTLSVVATPIGNLEDITLRALRVLREVRLIAAEDTRRTARLLAHHGIATPMLSFHEHNIRTRIPQLVARLEADDDIALVSDAGTPGISDPGIELVRECIDRRIAVDPVPGPSAPLVAATASGFPLEPLTIFGFPPARATARTRWFEQLAAIPNTVTFFEAPHRIRQTLTEAATLLGERPITIGRELTKLHQEFIHDASIRGVVGRLTEPRGEFTVVIGPNISGASETPTASDAEIVAEFGHTPHRSATKRRAIAALAKKYGRSSRDVYAVIERAKKSGA